MRPSSLALTSLLVAAIACRSSSKGPMVSAEAIVQGRARGITTDTIDEAVSIGLDRARWTIRSRSSSGSDFWSDIALLDIANAERSARSLDERTFAGSLRTLMEGDPEAAAVGFGQVHRSAKDPLVSSRARIGLTMALSWRSDWAALARIAAEPDTGAVPAGESPLAMVAGIERWARALSTTQPPEFSIPDHPVVLPMRRSAFGTPLVTVHVNGRPHEFWLDTGASMTLLSIDVAQRAGVKLAATDTLALGVLGGHIPAHAVYIDSIRLGSIVARGLGAALVAPSVLRLDQRVVNGVTRAVPISGMIGTDILRHLDVVLDAGAGTMTIRRPRRDPNATRNLFWVGYPVVRLVTRDGRPVLFGLDTGAEASYVTTTLLKKLPATVVATRRATFIGLGNKNEEKRSRWIARDVPLSDGNYAVALRNIPVLPEHRWTFIDFDGVIGSDVALATRMHLDFTNGIFDIRRSAGAPRPTGLEGIILKQ
jgi:hypothetical protein